MSMDLPNLIKDSVWVKYIKLNKNVGYGRAHNIALRKSISEKADFHIILNPDISFNSTLIEELIDYSINNSNIGYILPKVIYPDGSLQYLCKLLPTPFDLFFRRFLPKVELTNMIDKHYTLQSSGYNKIINPPCLSGCFMFLNVRIIEKHQILFDEQFFMYLEDFDFIRRLHRHAKTIFYPNATIIHDHAKKSYRNLHMLLIHIQSTIKYFNKYGWFFDRERKKMNKNILDEIEALNK